VVGAKAAWAQPGVRLVQFLTSKDISQLITFVNCALLPPCSLGTELKHQLTAAQQLDLLPGPVQQPLTHINDVKTNLAAVFQDDYAQR
jgi:hypothetical protein